MRVSLPLVTETKSELTTRQQDSARLLNCYFVDNAVRSCLGLSDAPIFDSGGSEIDGMTYWKGAFYAATNGELWNATTNTRLGAIEPGVAKFVNEGDNLAIVSGGDYRIWDGTTLLNPTTPSALDYILDMDFIDGFMILVARNGRHATSNVGLPATFDELDFASTDAAPDGLMAVVVTGGTVALIGSRTIELWRVGGGLDYPLSRYEGGIVERGAAGGVVEIDSTVIFLADDLRVMSYSGQTSTPISKATLDRVIAGDGDEMPGYDPSEIRAFAYDDAGTKFYVLRLPDAPARVLDTSRSAMWHERGTGVLERAWDAVCSAYDTTERRWYVGTIDGKITPLTGRKSDGGAVFKRMVQGTVRLPDYNLFTVNELEVQMRVGRNDTNAKVTLELSRDGETWKPHRERDLGVKGDYDHRVIWHALGQYRNMHARAVVTDASDFQVYGIYADIEKDLP